MHYDIIKRDSTVKKYEPLFILGNYKTRIN